ncbi:MAG: hypothetical protein M3R51_02620 [Candidatus Eremiobacteraeota bacterium]|nr:hypothetical protein [Candidatus Eremiobacteraeota bacterium]
MAQNLPSLDHVSSITDDCGIIQHSFESIPNRSTGYCTDDVARGFIVALMRARLAPRDQEATRLASVYLSFLHDAQLDDGRFHNFMSYERSWLDEIGTHDSCGRALWAIGYGLRYAPTAAWRRVCRQMLDRGMQAIDWLDFPRAEAYAMIGLSHAAVAEASPGYRAALRKLAERSQKRFDETREPGWDWFEEQMTYDNARLPESMIRAGVTLDVPAFADTGRTALDFYESVVFEDGFFVPIGNNGWYRKGGERSRFAQQPLEAVAAIDAELAAFASDGDPARLAAAEVALAWYYGKNSLGVAIASGSGCYDGLETTGVNRNMGAESTLAHLAGAYALGEHRQSVLRVVR